MARLANSVAARPFRVAGFAALVVEFYNCNMVPYHGPEFRGWRKQIARLD